MGTLWRIELLGGLRVVGADRVITRFRSHKTGALLAYLAFHLEQQHPRELLTEQLWPDELLDSARMRLRTALSSLRRQLEPPGIPVGSVIVATRHAVGLNPTAVASDVAWFEAALAAAERAPTGPDRAESLAAAVEQYRGPLLPGYFEEWIVPQQQRLAALYFAAVRELVSLLEQAGDLSHALDCAGRAVAVDPLREEASLDLIRLLAATGQRAAATRQFRELEGRLRDELGEAPSTTMQRLVWEIECGEFPQKQAPLIRRTVASRPMPQMPPPPASRRVEHADEESGYLPPVGTRFFGREAEIARLRRLLSAEGVRLVTFTGPGGSGKTRLALEAAGRLREALGGAVWFVPLADLTEPRRIIDAVHAALHLPRLPGTEPLEQMVEWLSRRPSLLVLDNLEQLMPGAVPVVRDLLERVPLLQCVVTSRQILDLAPEREIAVGPLPVPGVQAFRRSGVQEGLSQDPNARPPERLNALLQCESVALFVDRAQRALPDFQLTRSNAAAVAELCRRLEGIPLAIELAAAWAKPLTPARMLAGLQQRFELLVSCQRDLPSRHQTLRTALDWGYRLLPSELQQFFARLFIFRGGFTAAAAAVVAGSPEQRCEWLDRLQASSLVLPAAGEGPERRFRLLETLREFAAEQLAPEERDEVARRHAEYYLALAEAAEPHVSGGPRLMEWLQRLEGEHDNFRAALTWLFESEEVETGLRLTAALQPFWSARGYHTEGRERVMELLGLSGAAATAARANALIRAAAMANEQGDHVTGRALCEEGLAISREAGYRSLIQQGLFHLGNAYIGLDQDSAAHAAYGESLSISRELNDRLSEARSLRNLGVVAWRLNGFAGLDEEQSLTEQSLAICRQLGAQSDVAKAMINLANHARARGDDAAARSLLQSSLEVARELGNQLLVGDVFYCLGLLEQERVNPGPARAAYQESLMVRQEIGERRGVEQCLWRLVQVATMQGLPERAARLIGVTEAVSATRSGEVADTDWPEDDPDLVAARAAMGEERFAALRAEGRAMTVEQAVAAAG